MFKRFARGHRKPHVPGAMNKTEARYATHLGLLKLAGEIECFDFETVTLKLAKDLRYTPDFVVLTPSLEIEFHECKAGIKQKTRDGLKQLTGKVEPLFTDDAKVKIKMAAERFPYLKFCVVYENAGNWERVEFP